MAGGSIWGMVGEVKSVNARLLQLLVQADSIPVHRDDRARRGRREAERQRRHRRRRRRGGDEGGKARRRLRYARHPHAT